jgi:hypothetical protein
MRGRISNKEPACSAGEAWNIESRGKGRFKFVFHFIIQYFFIEKYMLVLESEYQKKFARS